MKYGISLLVLAALVAAASATPPAPVCKPGQVPGDSKGPFGSACEACTQCCDEECKLVTCHDCKGCGTECFNDPKIWVNYVDITCNSFKGKVECVVCNCPEKWNDYIPPCVEKELKKKLKVLLTRSQQCKIRNRLFASNIRLSCGLSTADKVEYPPPGYPFQCKGSNKKDCIIVDRSFPYVKIVEKKVCVYSGAPKCIERKTAIDTDCSVCKGDAEWFRSGKVYEVDQRCEVGTGKCTPKEATCEVFFSPEKCTKKCIHNKAPWCNKCLTIVNGRPTTVPRWKPLCVNSLHKDLFYGCYA